MIVQELKPSKRVKGRWLAMLEDGSILRVGENEVVGFSLYEGMELTDELAQQLQESARRGALKEKAIALLARKPMSRFELLGKLREWEASGEEAAAICERMEELGFLNDEEYASRLVRHYSAKGYGAARVRDELRRRGVPRELWDAALEEMEDSSAAIDAFLAKKMAGKPADRKELKKITDALARRGFSWSEIGEAIRRFDAQMDEWE